VQLLDGQRNSVYFLHKFGANHLGQRAAAGPRDEDPRVFLYYAGIGFHAFQKLEHFSSCRVSCR
jgi:hypothetical protein